MIKVAFYLPNNRISNVECADILKGNPGIGGSEYAILVIATYLTRHYSSVLDVYVIANAVSKLPTGLKTIRANGVDELPAALAECGATILVLKHTGEIAKQDQLRILNRHNVKVVMWAHNFMTRKELGYYAANMRVSRIVTVGKEQLDLYRDHHAFNKSVVIYNAFDVAHQSAPLPPFGNRQPIVTYIGSLIKAKGFHVLAKAWPAVIRAIPEAKLHIIGSGQLYDRSCTLGKLGIAEESYEKLFASDITDNEGRILPSIIFHGVLGVEKNDILRITKVGVPNPSGNTETFGYTALELQAHGAVVTTKKCPGYLETVKNGILYKESNTLAKAIITLLHRGENDMDAFNTYAEQKFSFGVISRRWYELFQNLNSGTNLQPASGVENLGYRMKWLREFNRRFKAAIPFGAKLPPVMFYENMVDQLTRRLIAPLKSRP